VLLVGSARIAAHVAALIVGAARVAARIVTRIVGAAPRRRCSLLAARVVALCCCSDYRWCCSSALLGSLMLLVGAALIDGSALIVGAARQRCSDRWLQNVACSFCSSFCSSWLLLLVEARIWAALPCFLMCVRIRNGLGCRGPVYRGEYV
jgi:hypothetical protein